MRPFLCRCSSHGKINHEVCHIVYADSRGNASERDFEQHALVFFEGIWYAKGYCRTRKDVRTLVLSRIKSIHSTGGFDPKNEIIKSASEDFIFDSKMATDVKVYCDNYLTKFIETRPLPPERIVKIRDDGSSALFVKSIPKHKLITWIMHQCGRAMALEPQEIKDEIKRFAHKIMDLSSEMTLL